MALHVGQGERVRSWCSCGAWLQSSKGWPTLPFDLFGDVLGERLDREFSIDSDTSPLRVAQVFDWRPDSTATGLRAVEPANLLPGEQRVK